MKEWEESRSQERRLAEVMLSFGTLQGLDITLQGLDIRFRSSDKLSHSSCDHDQCSNTTNTSLIVTNNVVQGAIEAYDQAQTVFMH